MWWKDTVFYQIYIPGFKDSNRDGTGDLQGLISEFPYLADLGIGAIWLTPFYPSPMVDNGYDISDYRGVNPLFGTLEDFDVLIREGEALGVKIIIDMVLNHTSTLHPWFQESRSSRTSPKRDWYIWRPEPPNNWESFFGGTAWKKDPLTNEFYYHAFAPEMADLNWECQEVRQAMYDVLIFWLDKGVKGFRLDVINFLKAGLPWNENNPVNHGRQEHIQDMNSPGLWEIFREIQDLTLPYGNIYLLGEVGSEDSETLASFAGSDRLDSIFNFNLGSISSLDFSRIRKELESHSRLYHFPERETTLFFSSHDMSRFATRLCGGNSALIKGLAALILTGPGVPLLYQGDELGIEDYRPEKPSELYDTKAEQIYREALLSGSDQTAAFTEACAAGRDFSRALYLATSRNIDSDRRPPVPPGPPFGEEIRRDQQQDKDSILSWVSQLIRLRHETLTFREGNFSVISSSPEHLVFRRCLEKEEWIIGINKGAAAVQLKQSYKTDRIEATRSRLPGEGQYKPITLNELPGETTLVFRVNNRRTENG